MHLADVNSLKDNAVAESHVLEFKALGVGGSHEDRREFLADASSFANASGGDMLFGVAESGGVATEVPGIDVVDLDKEELRLRSLLRDGLEPRLVNVGIRWLGMGGHRGVLLLRFTRSWIAPHRVTLQGHDKFYIRDSNGKPPMNVEELRRAFTLSETIVTRIRDFRAERIEAVNADNGPLPVKNGVKLVLHIIPLGAFVDPLDLQFHYSIPDVVPPVGASGYNYQYTLQGYATYSGPEGTLGAVRAYSMMFRTGIVEIVATVASDDGQRRLLSLQRIESSVVEGWRRYLSFAAARGIEPPFYVFLSVLGVRGFAPPSSFDHGDSPAPARRDSILFSEIEVTSDRLGWPPSTIFQRVFDVLANAFGLPKSPNST